jgi:kynurenine formamidase
LVDVGLILAPGGCLIRRNRRWIVHLLCLGLLFAQLGVVLHVSTHLKADAHAVCAKCLSAAPLQNMVGGGSSIIADADIVHARACNREETQSAPQRGFTGFRSRAPPAIS